MPDVEYLSAPDPCPHYTRLHLIAAKINGDTHVLDHVAACSNEPPEIPDLPEPSCKLGYTENDLVVILGDDSKVNLFNEWMRGQGVAVCNGFTYDPVADSFKPSGCGPHGAVTFPSDVERYIRERNQTEA